MRSHTFGSLLVLQGLFLTLGASGGPVLPGETAAAPPLSELSTGFGQDDPADASTLRSGATASDGLQPVATSAKRQNSDVASGAEPGAPRPLGQPHEASMGSARAKITAPRAQTGTNPAGPGTAIGDDLDPELKEAAKAALQWVREARERIEPARAGHGFDAADGSASAPAGSAEGSPGDMGSTPGPREYQATPILRGTIDPLTSAELDPIWAAIRLVKDIAGHPLTWLLMVLVGLGSVGVAFLQHRSHVARDRFNRHATDVPAGPSDLGARRRERRSASAAAIPPRAGRAEQKPGRPKARRVAKPR